MTMFEHSMYLLHDLELILIIYTLEDFERYWSATPHTFVHLGKCTAAQLILKINFHLRLALQAYEMLEIL